MLPLKALAATLALAVAALSFAVDTREAPAARLPSQPAQSPTIEHDVAPSLPTAVEAAVDADFAGPAGVVARDVVIGAPVEMPEGMGLIIETGCWHCDGPPQALYRAFRPPGGATEVRKLFEAGPQANPTGQAYITSFAMRPDGSHMVVAVCTHLYCGGLGYPEPGARATFYESLDGGITWRGLGETDEALNVIAVTDAGIAVARDPCACAGGVWLSGDGILTPPPGATELTDLTRRNGEVTWWSESSRRVVRADGTSALTLLQAEDRPATALNPSQPPLATWASYDGDDSRGRFNGYYLTTQALDGTQVGLRLGNNYAEAAQWLDEETIVATVEIETPITSPNVPLGLTFGVMTPSIVELYTGVVRPIAGLAGTAPFTGRNRVQAVFRTAGLIVPGPGCLPVRDRWRITAVVVDCVAPGALLQPTGDIRYSDARQWRAFILPDGRSGWAEYGP